MAKNEEKSKIKTKIKSSKQAREEAFPYAVCMIAYTLKLYASSSCGGIQRMSLKMQG